MKNTKCALNRLAKIEKSDNAKTGKGVEKREGIILMMLMGIYIGATALENYRINL